MLKKLLELCNYAGFSDCSYEDILPNWSGYLITDLFCSSPFPLSKENLEAVAAARYTYYGKMQKKLENLLTKLEFRYLQVITAPILFCYALLDIFIVICS